MGSAEKYIAVFGDTHGHLRLMFQLCRLWQRHAGRHLDGILQCGDLGFFPDTTRLDKATKKFARNDQEELGFAEYFALPAPVQSDSVLDATLNGDPDSLETVRAPVVFCHGNHEDFSALEAVTCGAVLSSVDVFERLYFLRSGETADVAGICVGAIGGAPESDRCGDEITGKYVSKRAINRLRKAEFDVLMTHGGPRGAGGETDQWGSQWIRELIDLKQPAFHVYGHHSTRIASAAIGQTTSIWLNDTNFRKTREGLYNGPVEHGCMAVLRWRDRQDSSLEVINTRWFRQVTGATWRHL